MARHHTPHCKNHDELPKKGECFIHQVSDVAPKQPRLKSCGLRCLGCPQQVYHIRKFTTVDHRHLYAVDQLKQAIVQEWI